MQIDEAVAHALSLPEAEETQPFGPDVLVYKVAGKMFATASEKNGVGQMNLKCDPERALELRDQYDWVLPGYHMNKRHWNTLSFENDRPPALVREFIEISYRLVVAGLKKSDRARLEDCY